MFASQSVDSDRGNWALLLLIVFVLMVLSFFSRELFCSVFKENKTAKDLTDRVIQIREENKV